MTLSPVLRLALGLVGAAMAVFIAVDLLFGLVPDEEARIRAYRSAIAELGGARVVAEIGASGDAPAIEATLHALRQRHRDLEGIAVRDNGGRLLASSGVVPTVPAASQGTEHFSVPIVGPQGRWGTTEFSFQAREPATVWQWATQPRLWGWAGLLLAMVAVIYLYMRRALVFLDPLAVVPERVRAAFDTLREGVALLDTQGRLVLANRALRDMAAMGDHVHARPFLDVAQLTLPDTGERRPWEQVVETARPMAGIRVLVGRGEAARIGSMNCSPIVDPSGKVQGTLITIADLTEIEASNDRLREALHEVQTARELIEEKNRELVLLANHDGLTGLLNRRSFFEGAQAACARAVANGTPIAVVMMDVDHFKSFNDKYGHATGDVVLQRVAQCVRETLREYDLLARYGGEEFCALLQGLTPAEAMALADRLRAHIEAEAGRGIHDGQDLTVTASLGVACAPPLAADISPMLKSADEALYVAKRGGRNRVEMAAEA